MENNIETLKKCIDTANELSCVLRWIENFSKELIDWYKTQGMIDGHILIQHILRKSGEEIF